MSRMLHTTGHGHGCLLRLKPTARNLLPVGATNADSARAACHGACTAAPCTLQPSARKLLLGMPAAVAHCLIAASALTSSC
jgi:hypothetical protein